MRATPRQRISAGLGISRNSTTQAFAERSPQENGQSIIAEDGGGEQSTNREEDPRKLKVDRWAMMEEEPAVQGRETDWNAVRVETPRGSNERYIHKGKHLDASEFEERDAHDDLQAEQGEEVVESRQGNSSNADGNDAFGLNCVRGQGNSKAVSMVVEPREPGDDKAPRIQDAAVGLERRVGVKADTTDATKRDDLHEEREGQVGPFAADASAILEQVSPPPCTRVQGLANACARPSSPSRGRRAAGCQRAADGSAQISDACSTAGETVLAFHSNYLRGRGPSRRHPRHHHSVRGPPSDAGDEALDPRLCWVKSGAQRSGRGSSHGRSGGIRSTLCQSRPCQELLAASRATGDEGDIADHHQRFWSSAAGRRWANKFGSASTRGHKQREQQQQQLLRHDCSSRSGSPSNGPAQTVGTAYSDAIAISSLLFQGATGSDDAEKDAACTREEVVSSEDVSSDLSERSAPTTPDLPCCDNSERGISAHEAGKQGMLASRMTANAPSGSTTIAPELYFKIKDMEASWEFEERFEDVRQAHALYSFSGNQEDELSVSKGNLLHLLGKAEEDWLVFACL